MSAATLDRMAAIGLLIRTQDNRATSHPIFVVQRKVRDFGIAPGYIDDTIWLHEGEEIAPSLAGALDVSYRLEGTVPDGCERVGYRERWEFVTACFTEAGAEEYIERNGHNLGTSRIYVESAYRNEEWQAVREYLASLGGDR